MPNFGYAKSCRGKQKHKSIGKAQAHLRALTKLGKDREGLHIYTCAFCKQYHVGRRPNQNGETNA